MEVENEREREKEEDKDKRGEKVIQSDGGEEVREARVN